MINIKVKNLKELFKQKKVMMIAVALIVVFIGGFKILGASESNKNTQAFNDSITVETEKVTYSDSIGGITYKANLEPAQDAAVSSNASGLVTQVSFENGDKVSQGQALAYLDDKDLQNQLKTAQIDLSKLQLELDSAKSDYDIASQLYEEGATSKINYENAMRAYKTVLSNIELKKVNIQDINNSLDDCVIKAPISGEAGAKNVTVGQYLNPGTVIASVKDNSSIKAEIQLMQEDLAKVAVGQEVTVNLSQDGSVTYKGIVESIAASANSQTRAFDCLIKIDNSLGFLNSGTFGNIEIPNKDRKQALTVPMAAVTGSGGDYAVFVLDGGVARKVTVEIGEIMDDTVEIKSGLNEGDTIIITNLNSLQDGDKVTVEGA